MKNIQFTQNAFEEYNQWLTEDKKVHQRLVDLIKEISRTPFTGKGKPEPLKHELKGYWSEELLTNIVWFIVLQTILLKLFIANFTTNNFSL